MYNVFEVLTIRNLDFIDKDKKPVKGMQLWLLGETAEPSWNGYEVVKLWIREGHFLESSVNALVRGDRITVDFDRKGRPARIELV